MGDKFTELTFEKLATAFHLLLVTKSLLLSNCCSAVFSRDFFYYLTIRKEGKKESDEG